MKSIYAIMPFIQADRIPDSNSVEMVLHDNMCFFIAYSDNLLILKDYMSFIDANFDDVFSKLKYPIVEYKYPNTFEGIQSAIINYIHERYNVPNNILSVENELIYETKYSHILDKNITVYLTYYAMENTPMNISNIFDTEYVTDVVYFSTKYLCNTEVGDLIKRLIIELYKYKKVASATQYGAYEWCDKNVVCEELLSIYNLKSYIKDIHERKNGREMVPWMCI